MVRFDRIPSETAQWTVPRKKVGLVIHEIKSTGQYETYTYSAFEIWKWKFCFDALQKTQHVSNFLILFQAERSVAQLKPK